MHHAPGQGTHSRPNVSGASGATAVTPFVLLDVNALSDQVTTLIRKDFVHFEPPLYTSTLTLDLNVVFRALDVCDEKW